MKKEFYTSIESIIEWYISNGLTSFSMTLESLLTTPTITESKNKNTNLEVSKDLNKEILFKNLVKNDKDQNFLDKLNSLENLKKEMYSIDCDLKNTANNIVLNDGNVDAKIMIIGEAPGEEEDIKGKPFVGKSGQLLRAALSNSDITDDDIYITNVIPFRPPYNRQPTLEEILLYEDCLKKHISIINPTVILLVGSIATKAIGMTNIYNNQNNKIDVSISKIRGKIFLYENSYFKNLDISPIPVVPTFHPSYLLRNPEKKSDYVHDLCLIKSIIKTCPQKK